MGRGSYILRLAYGRSAFEPPESAQLSHDPDADLHRGIDDDYVQLYDAKGHPFNEASRQYGRALRTAQNDCLAAVGVVVKNQGSRKARSMNVDNGTADRSNSNRIQRFALIILEDVAHRWLRGIRDRIMTFPIRSDEGFVHVIIDQYRSMGSFPFFFAGLLPALFAEVCTPAYRLLNLPELLDRIGMAIIKSRSLRQTYQRLLTIFDQLSFDMLDLIRTPLVIHGFLQSLGMLPTSQLLPPITTFSLRTSLSPFRPTPLSDDTLAIVSSEAFSPGLLFWLFDSVESWVIARVYKSRTFNLGLRKALLFSATFWDRADSAEKVVDSEGERLEHLVSDRTEAVHDRDGVDHDNGSPTGRHTQSAALDVADSSARDELRFDDEGTATRISSVNAAEGSMVITVQVGEATEVLLAHGLAGPAAASESAPNPTGRQPGDRQIRRRSPLPRAPAQVEPLADVVRGHVARIAADVVVAPLRFLLLQRIAQTFRGGYRWSSSPRLLMWSPDARNEVFALCNRWLLCFGIELIASSAICAGEVAYVLWQRKM